MRQLVINRVRRMLETWPELKNLDTNVPKKSWDDIDEFSDADLLSNLERLTRATTRQRLHNE